MLEERAEGILSAVPPAGDTLPSHNLHVSERQFMCHKASVIAVLSNAGLEILSTKLGWSQLTVLRVHTGAGTADHTCGRWSRQTKHVRMSCGREANCCQCTGELVDFGAKPACSVSRSSWEWIKYSGHEEQARAGQWSRTCVCDHLPSEWLTEMRKSSPDAIAHGRYRNNPILVFCWSFTQKNALKHWR